ncbi:DsrE family protein (plasmid) [Skermanella mucosa]|uniref:DsrE family protein n=1 Tax=Skermanella mucosa TaxID=1789672 RepID=UPI00192ABEDE|nr:DsrE family protein [Skermanella mucosa]UEM24238.1 DsrE family protein [Skermanella mucosa]
MKNRVASLAAGVLAAACLALPVSAVAKDSLFVVVTSPDAQTQGMAMVLTMQSLQRQTPVRVLLCGPGGDLALKDYAGSPLQPSGKTPQQMLQGAIQAGAQVELCALYLPNSNGRKPTDLIDGVAPVTPPAIGEFMDRPDVRYLTF